MSCGDVETRYDERLLNSPRGCKPLTLEAVVLESRAGMVVHSKVPLCFSEWNLNMPCPSTLHLVDTESDGLVSWDGQEITETLGTRERNSARDLVLTESV